MKQHLNPAILIALLLPYLIAPALADIQKERKHFLEAEKALNKRDHKTWQKLEPLLKGYPLYADLQFKRAIQTIGKTTEPEARQNLKALENTPLRKTYLKSWLKRLAGRKRWQSYIDFHEQGLGTEADCRYAEALFRQDKTDAAVPIVKKLWLVGKSRPDNCDPAFKFFRDSGKLSNALIWERIELAMNKGKSSLVRYLGRLLPGKEQQLVQEWQGIRSRPERVLKNRYTGSTDPHRQHILSYGIRRMALFEADEALKEWEKIRHQVKLSEDDKQSIDRYIARRLTTQKLDGAVSQHKKVKHPDHTGLEWAARASLQEDDWSALNDFINQMGDISSLSDRWKYWKARAAEQLGENTTAKALYYILASHRGYHNFLAADRLSQDYQLIHRPLSYERKELEDLQGNYNVRRTHELFVLGRLPEARREWYFLIRNYGDEDRRKLAYIIKQWGWHSQAILAISIADYDDDLSIRFPIMFEKQIQNESRRNGLDTSWVMAMVRQESAFQPDARSSAGARGLLQLMPGTGRQVARMLKRRRPKTYELYKPELNIKLGTHYLKTNMKKFAGNKVLATAAYNAGPHRVDKWLPENDAMPADAWTEAIPFRETRKYIQRIMSYAAIYDRHLGHGITPLNQRMTSIHPKDGP